MKKILLASAVALGLATPAAADVFTFPPAGSTTTIPFNGFLNGVGGTFIPELGAELTLTVTSVDQVNNIWNFNYTVANTTVAPFESEVSAFGFNTSPTITNAGATGDFGSFVGLNVNFSSGVGIVDFCASTGNNSCPGGSSNGVAPGDSESGTLFLDFAGAFTGQISLTDFVVRYQAINGPGVEGGSGAGFPIPAPIAGAGIPGLAMALLGMFGLNRFRRKRVA